MKKEQAEFVKWTFQLHVQYTKKQKRFFEVATWSRDEFTARDQLTALVQNTLERNAVVDLVLITYEYEEYPGGIE